MKDKNAYCVACSDKVKHGVMTTKSFIFWVVKQKNIYFSLKKIGVWFGIARRKTPKVVTI
jgi:hypothetical protein